MNDLEKEIEKDIHIIINEFKKTKSKNRIYHLRCSLRNLEDLIVNNNLNVKFPKEYEYEMNKFDFGELDEIFTYNYYMNSINMKPYSKKMCDMAKYFRNKYYFQDYFVYNTKTNIEDMLKIVNDFFLEYDSDIYRFFKEHVMSSRTYLLDLDIEGYSFFANYLTGPYTFISPRNTLEQAFTIAHEFIHSYISTRQTTMNMDQNITKFINAFDEVYPIFIELALSKYMQEHNFMLKDLTVANQLHSAQLIKYLELHEENDYLNRDSDAYSYGYNLSYHFYNQYLKDKDMAKENITNFMIDCTNHDKMYMLNHYGLNENDVLNPKKIEKHVSKSLIKFT